MADFTNNNIQDTYQRVLQLDNGEIQDGTGSAVLISTELSSIQAIGSPAITSGEWTQVKNIGTTTISNTQWGYLGGLDQNVKTISSVEFSQLSLTQARESFHCLSLPSLSGLDTSATHLRVDNTSAATPSIRLGENNGFIVEFIDQNNSSVARIDQSGVFSGTVASMMTTDSAQNVTGVKTLSTTTKLQFRDAGIYLNSNTDGTLQIVSDNKVNIFGDVVKIYAPLTASGNIWVSGSGNNIYLNNGHVTASGNISASGDIIGVTGSFDYVKTDKLQVGATGGTDILSIDGGDLQLENNKQITFADIGDGNTGRVRIVGNEDNDYIRMHVDNSNSHVLALTTTGVGIGTTSPGEKLEVVGNISASGKIYGRQIEQHDMSAGGFVISDSTLTYFPFGGQSHLENTNNLNQNIQKLAVVPGKPLKVNIKSVSNATGLGQTGFSCSYWRAPDGDSATSNLILVGEKRANSTGTNFEVVTFDFSSGVDSGSYIDVQDGDLVFMTILGDTTLSSMNVLAATALWEWDYSS